MDWDGDGDLDIISCGEDPRAKLRFFERALSAKARGFRVQGFGDVWGFRIKAKCAGTSSRHSPCSAYFAWFRCLCSPVHSAIIIIMARVYNNKIMTKVYNNNSKRISITVVSMLTELPVIWKDYRMLGLQSGEYPALLTVVSSVF